MSDLYADSISVVDRTRLQQFSVCPMQARLLEERRGVVGTVAVIGEEGHKAIFHKAVAQYLDSGGALSRSEVASTIEMNLMDSRPDVQPDVIEAFRSSSWGLAEHIVSHHPDNILHHDGGAGEKSGQLSCDMDSVGLRITSELDLVTATNSTEVVRDLDGKSGWKLYDIDSIRDEFQFTVHAWLLLNKYPEVQVVQVAVWQTRLARRTPWVDFPRKRLAEYTARIASAAESWSRYERCLMEHVPTWPSSEKCRICDCAAACPAAEREMAVDPGDQLDQLIATEARADALKKRLSAVVDETGRDIVSPSGACFGIGKPASSRKPIKSVYSRSSLTK